MSQKPSISYLAPGERYFTRAGQVVLKSGKGAVVGDRGGTLFVIPTSGHFLGQWVTFEKHDDKRPTNVHHDIKECVDFGRIKVLPPPVPTFYTSYGLKQTDKINKTIVLFIQEPEEVFNFVDLNFKHEFTRLPCFIYRKLTDDLSPTDRSGNKGKWEFLPEHVTGIYAQEDPRYAVDPAEYIERVRQAAPIDFCNYDLPSELANNQAEFDSVKNLMTIYEVRMAIKEKNVVDYTRLCALTNVTENRNGEDL